MRRGLERLAALLAVTFCVVVRAAAAGGVHAEAPVLYQPPLADSPRIRAWI